MRIDLKISYDEKEKAKKFGARWDKDGKQWYLESNDEVAVRNSLEEISLAVGRSKEDVAKNLPDGFLRQPTNDAPANPRMFVEELLSMSAVKYGSFPYKPEDAKTINGWMKDGMIPISKDHVEVYAMQSKENQGYQYVRESFVRKMSEEENRAYLDVMQEKRKASSADKVHTKKAAETKKEASPAETQRDSKKKEQNMNRLDAFKAYIASKGEEEEFKNFYLKYVEEHPLPEKKESTRRKEKVIHVPNFGEICGKRILCFDTETTGYSPEKGDELLQAAFVSIENGQIQTKFESLIKPHERKEWVGAMIKNHISPRMVKDAPYPEELKDKVQSLVDGYDVVVGYNIEFDIRFLSVCMGVDFSGKIVADPMDYFKKKRPDCRSHNLESCVCEYCSPSDLQEYKASAHKADTDAIATLKCLCRQAKEEGYDLGLQENGMEQEENLLDR